MQVPMISSPLKQTNEIDWVAPLKHHIRAAYGDDPERYSEECAQLNRLRQDMRGAGRDSAAGRDLLYRYYGQLELLDLRFPVDENHIKISFTWFDAFTHKPTSQYSLAYEKASIIFNISAVLSCHAANQNRHEDVGLKTAYHSFQASAGMFTYINENFLHAPSTDLSRETVKTLISIMLAQGQEVFIEKQVIDGKKPGLLAKLASQAAYIYAQAVEGVQDNVSRAVFERVWLLHAQIKQHHMASLAQYHQAVADYEANSYGQSICRLQAGLNASKEASRLANGFPGSVPSNSNLSSETGTILADVVKKHMASVQERIAEYTRDNDMIYHQPVPTEANLPPIPKLPAAKAIPVSELYQGQDIQKIIGPDIFQRIVPMSVTESASLYDEEKAKLVRAETERVEGADDELAASLDYLKLPGSLNILKGGSHHEHMSVDEEFRSWCSDLAGHSSFDPTFEKLREEKQDILSTLESCVKQLDMEESVCEKMRSKYAEAWTQQPSTRLTTTLRTDARSYRSAVEEASTSDAQLYATFRQHEADFDEMRSAGETDEADVLYQRAMIKAGAGKKGEASPGAQEGNLLDDDFADESRQSVAQQIERVEELCRKLQLVKRERSQVLKDLKEKIHADDISSVLILSKKSTSSAESALFKSELEKFRPHQTRILQAVHKQSSLMKDLTRTYGDLLQDQRVRSEQSRYEAFSRQRGSVLGRYRRVYQAYRDLGVGLERARGFYGEMRETVQGLEGNVKGFVENRRSEGGQLLSSIEASRGSAGEREQGRMRELMERMSVGSPQPGGQRPSPLGGQGGTFLQPQQQQAGFAGMGAGGGYNPAASPPATPQYAQQPHAQHTHTHQGSNGLRSPTYTSFAPPQAQQPPPTTSGGYNPSSYGPVSPPAHQQYFSPPPNHPSQPHSHAQGQGQGQGQFGYAAAPGQAQAQGQSQQGQQYGQKGWQPPPPPPGPPPQGGGGEFGAWGVGPSGPGGWAGGEGGRSGQRQGQQDPWAGLSGWQ